ncbi:MAG: PAS domain-containing protein, partial [Gammaproteobacteria bacterium]|nr:PAS domain-containing protein [Gammaproteobacteria bacterium]
MADGVYVREKSGHIVDTNTALCALSGYTRAELVRMHVRELYVLPETEIQRLLDVSNGAFQVRGEWQLKCKDNQRLPVEVSSGFIGSDRIIAVIHDLRKRTASGTRLHSAERLFALMESEINDVLFSLSVESEEQYRFKFANSAFYRATGLKPHEVVGQPVQAVIPEPSLAQVLKHYRQAIREKRVIHWDETSEYSTGIKHGEVVVMPVFNSQGACTELVGRVHDITERKQHELVLERQRNLYAMLSQTNQAIVRLHNRDDLFLAVCHTA